MESGYNESINWRLKMRAIIWLLILAVVVFLGYRYYQKSMSDEERQVKQLEKEFSRAEDSYISAVRQTGEIGLTAIADPEAAANKVKAVRERLRQLMSELEEDKAMARARALEDRILHFCRANHIE